MRELSADFFDCLEAGFLSPLTDTVRHDPDLNLEIRDSYINVYYKGNSLLKLTELGASRYRADIHAKFREGLKLPGECSERTMPQFLKAIPFLKQNIVHYGKRSIELEYEQMIIRANNFEPRNNTEYFVVDRQYSVNRERFDLTGVFWDRRRRRPHQEVPICLMEIKFALNADIRGVHRQLERYYEAIRPRAAEIAGEMQAVFRQKIDLGLYQQPIERLAAMRTLTFYRSIEKFQFILVLVDYNPNSSKFDPTWLSRLPFADQVKVFYGGFAMWTQNVLPPGRL